MEKKNKVLVITAAAVFICSTLFFLNVNPAAALSSGWIDEKKLGELCIAQLTPVSEISSDTESAADDSNANKDDAGTVTGEKEDPDDAVLTSDPMVIIYHTHSTESYMPYKESNYHREAEEGTVRDVGSVLESELKKQGINVVHDKTIHDRPSYNESYNKSLATIEALRDKYPSALYIIDLHRDAAPASASEGKYIRINGSRTAKFSMVVGQANDNYVELYDFAEKISEKAETMYEGFGGAIIERNYNYNEYLTDRCLLLEIGNNKNTIEEARLCGKYFARVLAEIINEEQ